MNLKNGISKILRVFLGIPEFVQGSPTNEDLPFQINQNVSREIPYLLKKYSINSVFEFPCGSKPLMAEFSEIDDYTGAEVNVNKLHPLKISYPRRIFKKFNPPIDAFPKVDLIVIRNYFEVSSFSTIHKVLENIKSSKSKYLLVSNSQWKRFGNVDLIDEISNTAQLSMRDRIKVFGKAFLPDHHPWHQYPLPIKPHSSWRRINLQLEPFNLGQPIEFIIEGISSDLYQDRSLFLWEVKDL